HKKHDGSLPLIGVNTFLPKEHAGDIVTKIELIRSNEEEKRQQIDNVENYRAARNHMYPSPSGRGAGGEGAPGSLAHLQQVARDRKNIFASLMEAVKYNSLGQISHALYEVGGEYRRNM
ncbi:MAG: methylmalonyl-CoA mutase, partial [Gammaproteobacteria bacterium]|nr:methylmalonyl-CoA mutase [Gammaproteobacteria bacterium]